jgi:hypothetical protein
MLFFFAFSLFRGLGEMALCAFFFGNKTKKKSKLHENALKIISVFLLLARRARFVNLLNGRKAETHKMQINRRKRKKIIEKLSKCEVKVINNLMSAALELEHSRLEFST